MIDRSINELARDGVTAFRKGHWTNKDDHVTMDIVDGKPGPWFKLWSNVNELLGRENPFPIIVTQMGDLNEKSWHPYKKVGGNGKTEG